LLLDFETVPIVWYYYFLSLFVLVLVFVLQYILIDLLKCFFYSKKKMINVSTFTQFYLKMALNCNMNMARLVNFMLSIYADNVDIMGL